MDWLTDIGVMRDVILPALDVLLLAFIIYRGYQILVQTRAVQLVKGAVFMGLTYAVAFFLNLRTLLWLLNLLAPSLVIALAIIFQPELRKIFTRIGQGRLLQFTGRRGGLPVDAVLSTLQLLSYRRRGALVVISRTVGLKNVIESGTTLNAEVSSPLILSIFGHDTPLHDGAVIVEGSQIVAAGCFLPLSDQMDIRRSFGTRHRAALGIAEETDAVVLVVSEETGAISLAYDARLYYDLTVDEMKRRLRDLIHVPETEKEVESIEE